MIKLEIWPSFINTASFELKQREQLWELFVIKDANEFINDKGNIWRASNLDPSLVEKILHFANLIIDDHSKDRRIGLDGVSCRLMLKRNGEDLEAKFWSPEQGTNHLKIVSLFFELIEQSFSEHLCINYMELLGQYFFDIKPIKEFQESPFRLKVYGGLSSSDEQVLSEKINILKSKTAGILDMSNFLTTGTILNSYFLELRNSKHIKIIVNKNAYNYLTEIGFNKSRLELISA